MVLQMRLYSQPHELHNEQESKGTEEAKEMYTVGVADNVYSHTMSIYMYCNDAVNGKPVQPVCTIYVCS